MYWIAKDCSLLLVERAVALSQEEFPTDSTGAEIRPSLPITVDSDVEEVQADSNVEVLHQPCLAPSKPAVQSHNSFGM
ncbi:hypothetical protein MJO28_015578 [Puccinia striiformis f. sp. tritici]|uniref:Uncharacterized protein n=1 Tax=Puccinia striiformis f. sp. tritici TaxID=168172 RepID=A0ACC0DRY7_9BASI|nr:hypothetical protein MJO28_015578 [Puccinia striiformis f. sp. tritici]